MKFGSEKFSVQNPIVNYVCEPTAEYQIPNREKFLLNLGWEYIGPDEATRLRGGETRLIFKDIFLEQIKKINNFMSEDLCVDLLRKIEQIHPTINGNLILWEYLKGLRTVFVKDQNREKNVKLIDTENIENNVFQVTDEFIFSNEFKTVRFDIVFLINGIPLILVETKAAHKTEGISEALEQIRRYHKDSPEILALMQIYAITHLVKYYYSATWSFSAKTLFNWKEEVQGDFETLVKTFFDKNRIVKLITDFILFTRQDDEIKKVVLRPHQMRAIKKIIERAKEPEKNRGLIWHTQGSGKTYTMIVAAKKIVEEPHFKDPTVIMLVDRNELESQLFGNIKAVGIESAIVVETKEHLKRLLQEDKRGIIVSMIHKFDRLPEKINERRNIFILVDEAHRTTGGKLGNYLMGALPNATIIGFTGTPIDRTTYGQGTFIVFGKDDPPKGYLDKYSILESIEEGTTVPLHYSLAPNELQIDKETLEKEFLQLAEAEGISDIENLNKVLEKAVTLKNILKSKDRVKKVAQYVVEHFKEFVEPMGYKAFLVGVDREACVLYKEELDRLLPSEYSCVVFSSNFNDPPELVKYHLKEDEEKRIRKAFRKPNELPKILIVTEKLLTGFDAPILYCMYLDKPMRDHVLLQAIARVNRPYEDEEGRKKPCGFVLDFVGIFDNLEKALAFDSADIEGVVKDIEELKSRFSVEMQKGRENYLSLIKNQTADKAVEKVLEYFIDEERRQDYYQFFRQLQDLYEILSPDAFLREYLDDFETLGRMYRILREAYEPSTPLDKDFARKTAKLLSEQTKVGVIKPALEVYEINENTLSLIENSNASDTEKVFNIIKSIQNCVNMEGKNAPYLLSIGEKAELILKMFKERQKTTQEVLEETKKLVQEINSAKKEQIEKGMSSEIYTVYKILEEVRIPNPEKLANEINKILKTYPHWKKSKNQEAEVRKEFYSLLSKAHIDIDSCSQIVGNIFSKLKFKGKDE
ncbi:MAG: HsdR family type I site-specific deoxyribonuclease [Ignavibacteria bacterium]|nr:HsdR family type I site-specific deoxyribonuclease [Ignavibacteria bacterium]